MHLEWKKDDKTNIICSFHENASDTNWIITKDEQEEIKAFCSEFLVVAIKLSNNLWILQNNTLHPNYSHYASEYGEALNSHFNGMFTHTGFHSRDYLSSIFDREYNNYLVRKLIEEE